MITRTTIAVAIATNLCLTAFAWAEIRSESVTYYDGDTRCVGYLAYDDSLPSPGPAVLVVHEWWGLNDYAKERVEQLASMGYVAMAADIYGDGYVAPTTAEAGRRAGQFKDDPELLRGRVRAALKTLAQHERVDASRIAAIGYCFGGMAVLELARSGADVRAVVSFHGGLATSRPAEQGQIRATVLVLHGADDPFVPAEEIETFQEEMRNAKADWQMNTYGGAVHSFTNPQADKAMIPGAAYNAVAAERAWEAMKLLFAETIGNTGDADSADVPPKTTGLDQQRPPG